MKHRLCFVLLAISTVLGCTHTARLYPVQGPLSAQTPVPVLMAKITGAFTPGNISVILSDGEVCKGRWVIVNPAQAPKGANTATAPTSAMSAVWDGIYGPGFYVSRVLGARYYAQAMVSGNRGTILNVEMYRPVSGADTDIGAIKGVAKDNKDNVYKLVL
jgi:hypothetical protein